MTDAEKEAREIVDAVIDAYLSDEESGSAFDSGHFIQRILRFAREYGPELAREAVGQACVIRDGADIGAFGGWLRGEELTPPLLSVADTTPAGWTRDTPPAIGGPLREWSPPERGKPF